MSSLWHAKVLTGDILVPASMRREKKSQQVGWDRSDFLFLEMVSVQNGYPLDEMFTVQEMVIYRRVAANHESCPYLGKVTKL